MKQGDNVKIRSLIVLWLVVIAALSMCGAGVPQLGFGGNTGLGLRTGLGTGGDARVDTFRILSRDKQYPPTAQVTAGNISSDLSTYTTVNSDGKGGGVRWGYVQKSQPDVAFYSVTNVDYVVAGQGGTGEDNYLAWNAGQYMGFIWVSANGLTNGQKIESAYLMFSPDGTLTVASGEYVVARLDTNSSDYRMLATTTSAPGIANADTARFYMSWNHVNKHTSEAWTPPLDSRLDRHDFGPRSNSVIGPGTYRVANGNHALKLDVTDAVQQASDNGELGRGLLFMIYASSLHSTVAIAAGNYTWVTGNGGCPSFVATATTRRGQKPWGGTHVPFVMTFDDSWPAHAGYYTAMTAAGHRFSTAIYRTRFEATNYDSLTAPNLANIDIMHHGKTHIGWGSVTGAALNTEIELDGMYSTAYWSVKPDTNAIIHAAWPGGSAQYYGLEAVSKLVGYGFTSARAFNIKTTATSPIGLISPPSWTQPMNLYAVGSVFASAIFLNGAAAGDSLYVKEKLEDYIDLMYTDYNKSALVVYAHKTSDGVTQENLGFALRAAQRMNSTEPMSYTEMIARRMAPFMDPATITTANGYTADQQTTAARYDSLRTANGDDKMLSVWISPK